MFESVDMVLNKKAQIEYLKIPFEIRAKLDSKQLSDLTAFKIIAVENDAYEYRRFIQKVINLNTLDLIPGELLVFIHVRALNQYTIIGKILNVINDGEQLVISIENGSIFTFALANIRYDRSQFDKAIRIDGNCEIEINSEWIQNLICWALKGDIESAYRLYRLYLFAPPIEKIGMYREMKSDIEYANELTKTFCDQYIM